MTDYSVGSTIYLMFTTRSFSTGAPTQLAGVPVVSAYENDSLTQITAGITLGVDHDGITGLNLLTIVATGANGYEAGKDYNMVVTTGTVDGVSWVGEVVGTFSLERSAAVSALATAQADLDAILVDTTSLNDTKIPDTISLANINAEIDTAFTSQMADSVPTIGTIATREQALYMILQFLTEKGAAGTAVTVRKVDGSTALMTLTLDNATTPTDITRAT